VDSVDVAIVGAGAAGLMAAIHAGREIPGRDVVLLDGVERLGRKILISGGGRCNVTHDVVSERDFAGSTPPAIRKVLRAFDETATRAFFAGLGVPLVREETGKLFPASNRARSVLEALLGAVRDAGVRVLHPWRVEGVERSREGFRLAGPAGAMRARTVVLATGGRSLPETGSDGHGYAVARALGHATTPRIVPALVPLLLPEGHPLTTIRGVSLEARLRLERPDGGRLAEARGPVLFTHFGLSGPAVLDVSRHWVLAAGADRGVRLVASWLPDEPPEALARFLGEAGGGTVLGRLQGRLPNRLATVLLAEAGVDPSIQAAQLRREARRALVGAVLAQRLPITGDRGWRYAEVTAGGIPLAELDLARMASRKAPGLFLCGEILDVDGRIGGFNFQWAWSTGFLAGGAAVRE
jgi:hypothetical protein